MRLMLSSHDVGQPAPQGDSLFIGGCGRMFEGDPESLYATMERFRALPEETLLFCGACLLPCPSLARLSGPAGLCVRPD